MVIEGEAPLLFLNVCIVKIGKHKNMYVQWIKHTYEKGGAASERLEKSTAQPRVKSILYLPT